MIPRRPSRTRSPGRRDAEPTATSDVTPSARSDAGRAAGRDPDPAAGTPDAPGGPGGATGESDRPGERPTPEPGRSHPDTVVRGVSLSCGTVLVYDDGPDGRWVRSDGPAVGGHRRTRPANRPPSDRDR